MVRDSIRHDLRAHRLHAKLRSQLLTHPGVWNMIRHGHASRSNDAIRFANRRSAGIQLGEAVSRLHIKQPVLVLGLPRGGVPVAYEVARAIDAALDVMVVRKIGMPGEPELAIGALAV